MVCLEGMCLESSNYLLFFLERIVFVFILMSLLKIGTCRTPNTTKLGQRTHEYARYVAIGSRVWLRAACVTWYRRVGSKPPLQNLGRLAAVSLRGT